MPEGDTLHRTAHTLNRVLGKQRLLRVRSSVPAIAGAELAGHVVEEVSALGKNLLIRFDDGRVLHTHLKMRGSWHVYRPGERFQRPEHQARVVLEVADALAVCFAAPTVRLLASNSTITDEYLNGLGPDLIPDEFDLNAATNGLLALSDLALGEAVMTQTALAGIGNIYKSETLFLCRMNPFARVSTLSREHVTTVVLKARELLRASVQSQSAQRQLTLGRSDGQYWVYKRSGRACHACAAAVLMLRQGAQQRSTYFCPACQHVQSTP
ncbi:MAG: DNA-formamidopyrimidine glycosylase family protein [Polyangiaceae bacterium]